MLARAALSGLISIVALSVAPAQSQPSAGGSAGLFSPVPMTGSSPEHRYSDRSVAAPSSTPTSPQEAEQDAAPLSQKETAAPSASTPTPGPSVDQTGNRARRDTNHPQAAAPPSPHSLRASSPAGGREGSLHSETTRYAALASTSEGPPGSKEPRPGEYVGSKKGGPHAKHAWPHQRGSSLRRVESLNCPLA